MARYNKGRVMKCVFSLYFIWVNLPFKLFRITGKRGVSVLSCWVVLSYVRFSIIISATQPNLSVRKAKRRSGQLQVDGLEPCTGGISLVNWYGCSVMTSASKYEFSVWSVGLKARLSVITETNYHVSLWKTTEGELRWMKGMCSYSISITARMSSS